MSVKLKPLHEQVFLITGASSGIGRVTARRAAALGAKVVLIARNENALRETVEQIKQAGGEATYAVADVADADAFAAAADAGVAAYGSIDTWVNNAGIGMQADISDAANIDDDRKIFETNFWGLVNGSRIAAQHLRDNGGALINVGSEVSDVTTPMQGMYAASKHAVLGFTDAFRMEVIKSDLPISVTLIKPAGIDTPFAKHLKNNTENKATLPAPVYSPELVADQILHAAEFGGRELYVGGGGRAMVMLAEHFPTLADWVIAKFMPSQEQKLDQPADNSNEALHQVGGGAYEERGHLEEDGRTVRERSLYGVISRNPLATTIITAAVGAGVAYLLLKPASPQPSNVDKLKARAQGYAKKARRYGPPAAGYAKAVFGDYADTARDAFRGYVDKAKTVAGDYVERAKSAASDYADTARGYADTAKDAAHDHSGDAKGTARGYADRARGYADDAKGYVDAGRQRARDAADAGRTTAGDYASAAKGRLHDAANEYVAKPAEQLLAGLRRSIDKFLG